jgi:nicotinate-nucleotide pyrophosphorylase (carboxylating)
MLTLDPQEIAAFARMVLAEDHAENDVTSLAVVSSEATARGIFVAREPMVLAGMALAEAIVRAVDPAVTFTAHARDGDRLEDGAEVATLSGPARAILTAERSALNTLQHLSGIATYTRQYVDAIEGTGAVLLDTRKTIPGLRRIGKYATSVGGAENHRMTLADAILIKDNHIAIQGGVTAAIEAARAGSDLPIEIECDTLEQAQEALACGITHILLDNMTPFELRRVVALASGKARLEASGGVTLESIRRIAETGVDYISVGRLTQSAPAVDIGLDFQLD